MTKLPNFEFFIFILSSEYFDSPSRLPFQKCRSPYFIIVDNSPWRKFATCIALCWLEGWYWLSILQLFFLKQYLGSRSYLLFDSTLTSVNIIGTFQLWNLCFLDFSLAFSIYLLDLSSVECINFFQFICPRKIIGFLCALVVASVVFTHNKN